MGGGGKGWKLLIGGLRILTFLGGRLFVAVCLIE